MTRDEVLQRLREARAEFDAAVAAIPEERLHEPTPGGAHSPVEIVAHINAYEELIVARLRASRAGERTFFDRDLVGWEEFNERIWREASAMPAEEVFARSSAVFGEMLDEIGRLTDEELAEPTGATAMLDEAWLEGKAPWELIGIDGFDHYPMHLAALNAAANG